MRVANMNLAKGGAGRAQSYKTEERQLRSSLVEGKSGGDCDMSPDIGTQKSAVIELNPLPPSQ